LREVLTNLIFNAIDAMPEGGRLIVRTWSSERETCLSVTDTGTGMSESVRQRLFEPFFTTKGERGNGLGLSVTFGIVQRYGGEIKVESEVGKGSTFVVCLPALGGQTLHTTTKTGNGPSAESSAGPRREAAGLGDDASHPPDLRQRTLRILVIDDEATVR